MTEIVITLGRYVIIIISSHYPISPHPSVTSSVSLRQCSGRCHRHTWLVSCCMRCVMHVALEWKPTHIMYIVRRSCYCTWRLGLSYSQNINQLEIFGDMSTPPDITSPSVSSCRTCTVCDLHLINSQLYSQWCVFLLFSLNPTSNHRPPPLLPTPSTPRRACSLPRNCLLPSILRLCPQVGPCSFSA